MKVHRITACPACGEHSFTSFALREGHELRRCRACDTVSAAEYADPSDIYTDGYLFGETDFGLDLQHPAFQELLRECARRRLDEIERSAGRAGQFLDIGCGSGEVLAEAAARGWRAQGVEPERTGAEVAIERGLDVKIARLEDSGLPERDWDVVTAFHVLEHLPDSRDFLRTLARWARPGGFVAVEVPNLASAQRRRYGSDWPGLRPLEHIVHFTPETLAETFRRAGITPVSMRSPSFISPPQSLEQALYDLARPAGRLRKLLERASRAETADGAVHHEPSPPVWALLRGLDRLYDRLGVGAVVQVTGRVS